MSIQMERCRFGVWLAIIISLMVLYHTFQETQNFVVSTTTERKSTKSSSLVQRIKEAIQHPPKNLPRVWVQLTFSLEFEADLMPHTLHHYIHTLQVDPQQVLVALHHQDEFQERLFDETETWMRQQFGIRHILRWTGEYTSNRLWKRRVDLRAMVNISDCDWIVRSDSDEFPAVPGNNIGHFLNFVALQGYDSVFGTFNDRVAKGGQLLNISEAPSLTEQFPLSCHITDRIVRANMQKAIAFRGYHQENRGGHYLLNTDNHTFAGRMGEGTDHCGYPSKLRIDHYKWTYPVIDKLRRRAALYEEKGMHFQQSQRVLDHIDEHHGKFDLKELDCVDTNTAPVGFKLNYEDIYVSGTHCGQVQCSFFVDSDGYHQ